MKSTLISLFSQSPVPYEIRTAKITPKKNGLFVSIWKRDVSGTSQPPQSHDHFEFLIVKVREKEWSGFFIFPKKILIKKRIVMDNGKGGKRGIRVYPPWTSAMSKQAKHTQEWQVYYFWQTQHG